MQKVKSIHQLQKIILSHKKRGKKIGFVPTMGALHAGHLSLVKLAKRENDIVVTSIFVNPTQFAPGEDFKKYPRTVKKDEALLEKAGVDILFYPSDSIIYPKNYLTFVEVGELGDTLCGKFRPGHFKGVATIVAKLLNIVSPGAIYLGQKDAQQAFLLKKMIADLNFPVIVRICPTVRETDGLAMSSRNVYLGLKERKEATILFQALNEAKKLAMAGERNSGKIKDFIAKRIKNSASGKIQYISCVELDTLKELKALKGKTMIALAVYFGKTRLIDNIIFTTR